MVNILHSEEEINFQLPITAQESYLNSITNYKYGWFFSSDFILPFIVERKLFFKRLIFTCEVVKKIEFNDPNFSKERLFFEEIINKVKETSAHFIHQPNTNVVFNTFPVGSIEAKFGSYQVDLLKTEEDLFLSLHHKHRNVIRKSKRDGVIVKTGCTLFSDFFKVYQDTMARQNLNYSSESDLKKMALDLGDNVLISVAYKDEKPQGCSMLLFKKGFGSYYFYGGSVSSPYTGAINLMHWENMMTMKDRGVIFYDFVGARISPIKGGKTEGLQRFKKRFGSEMKEGYLWKYPTNKIMYRLFCMLAYINARIHRRIYTGDIIDQERGLNEKGHNINL